MCGIVGYIGNKQAQRILISGLKRLEYRGYDSAGIVTMDKKGHALLLKSKGRVSELEPKVKEHETSHKIGIGHTRWATHGVPSKRNAHPQNVGSIYIVHNGIIENYLDLKEMLFRLDYEFKSDTDTEVLAALIDYMYKSTNKNLLEAVTSALKMVVGTYGIAVISEDDPNEIIVARKGSPLIIGLGHEETFIASDAAALVGYTDRVIYLNDGEIGVCDASGLHLYDEESNAKEVIVKKIELDLQTIQKKGFKHFLIKEIYEQPESLRATLRGRINAKNNDIKLGGLNIGRKELGNIKHLMLIGCGTAYHAGLLASYIMENLLPDVTFSVEIASELRYRSFFVPADTVALIISQSGETADTIACLDELKKRGVKCLGFVNVVGSTIAREVDGGVYLHAGAEISVASTKAFTSQVAALILFGLTLAESKGISRELIKNYIDELNLLPSEIEKTIKEHDKEIENIVKDYLQYDKALFAGRNTLYPTALEGALKLKEVSYIYAEAYAAGELKHGPIALIDDNAFEVFFLQDNWLYEKSQNNLIEMEARRAHAIVITDTKKRLQAETIIRVDTKLNLLTPLVFNIISQLLAYHMSVARGNDVDRPRNLAKSVTVE